MNNPSTITTLLVAAISGAISAALIALVIIKTAPSPYEPDQTLQTQIKQLESQIAREQQARLDQLTMIEQIRATQLSSNTRNEFPDNSDAQPSDQAQNQTEPDIEQLTPLIATQTNPTTQRLQALIAAGFSDDEADSIIRRESEAALERLNQQYRARRERLQVLAENGNENARPSNSFREEIGDESYERYLKSRGLPTEVEIATVLHGSAGEAAGLEFGDRITSYGGERVFNVRELNQLTLGGSEGESVLVEFEREGETVQTTIPRGPIGITSDSNIRNNRNLP